MFKSNSFIWLTLLASTLLTSGCRSQVPIESNNLSKVESDATSRATLQTQPQTQTQTQTDTQTQTQTQTQSATAPVTSNVPVPQIATDADMQAQINLAHECTEAWKIAVQQKDEATAMKMLEKLAVENPKVSQVQLMMGQVKDYFKKYDQALVYYRKAYAINKFSSIQILRLASSLRRNNKFDEAESHYNQLLKNLEGALAQKPDEYLIIVLASVRTGKAACLKAAGKKEEALAMVKKALTEDPGNLEAKELLKNLGG